MMRRSSKQRRASLPRRGPSARFQWRAADVGDAAVITHAIKELAAALGRLDVLVNNAAARAYGTVAQSVPESWDAVLQTNVKGVVNCARAALPFLRECGSGSIVNVSSAFALTGRENMGAYDASKAAMLALTRVLACEEAKFGIRVNAVCPGSTLTPWTMGRATERGMSIEELKQGGAAASLLRTLGRARGNRVSHSLACLAGSFVRDRHRPAGRWRADRDVGTTRAGTIRSSRVQGGSASASGLNLSGFTSYWLIYVFADKIYLAL